MAYRSSRTDHLCILNENPRGSIIMRTLNRRVFTQTLVASLGAGLGAAALPASLTAQTRKQKIGCTSLIWGALPRTPDNFEAALRDMAALGYHKAETFASIVEDWDTKGTLGDLLAKYPVPLVSGYETVKLTDTSTRKDDLAVVVRRAKILKKYGAKFMVLAPNGVGANRAGYNFAEHKANIVSGLNEFAKAANDVGLGAGLHQHTNTAIETRDETYAVMEAVDTRHCKFAPDVGQLQKGGADAAKVIKDFLPITVHMHLKDFSGGEHMGGYCPLGMGKVDLKAILGMMEGNPDANVMHELDGSSKMPYTAHETARISKAYLETLGYTFKTT
jgi:inosose dehydratase